jgi:hypothetical protein
MLLSSISKPDNSLEPIALSFPSKSIRIFDQDSCSESIFNDILILLYKAFSIVQNRFDFIDEDFDNSL